MEGHDNSCGVEHCPAFNCTSFLLEVFVFIPKNKNPALSGSCFFLDKFFNLFINIDMHLGKLVPISAIMILALLAGNGLGSNINESIIEAAQLIREDPNISQMDGNVTIKIIVSDNSTVWHYVDYGSEKRGWTINLTEWRILDEEFHATMNELLEAMG